MRVLVVMDPIETVNLKKDSTMAMLAGGEPSRA